MPVPPLPPGPPEITVKIQPNAECITPLQLGNISYEYPTQLITDKISEIVVTGSPLSYSRFAAQYGQEPTVNVSRSGLSTYSPIGNANLNFQDGNGSIQSSLSLSSFADDPDYQLFDNATGVLNLRLLNQPGGGVIDNQAAGTLSIDTPRWSLRDSTAYYPQLDFFPRYNQWFASTVWSIPFDTSSMITPGPYSIMFVYIDKTNKQVYHKESVANFEVIGTIGAGNPGPSIVLTGSFWRPVGLSYSGVRPWYLYLRGSAKNFTKGAWRFSLSSGGNVFSEIVTDSNQLPNLWPRPLVGGGEAGLRPSSLLGAAFPVTVTATSFDENATTVISDTLIVRNPNA